MMLLGFFIYDLYVHKEITRPIISGNANSENYTYRAVPAPVSPVRLDNNFSLLFLTKLSEKKMH